ADVEPHRTVEGRHLVEQQVGELVGERFRLTRRGEVALPLAPRTHRTDHAPDQLANARLALRGADRTTKILGNDHVVGELRPALRDLDVVLLEAHLSLFTADDRAAALPFDRRVWVNARPREETTELKCPPPLVALLRPLATLSLLCHQVPPDLPPARSSPP